VTGLALIRRVEHAQLSVWPGVRTAIDGSWILRLAGGHTNRANSLNILDPNDTDAAKERFDWALRLYRRAGLPLVLRVTPLTPPSVIALADAHDFRSFGETLMLTHDDPAALAASAAPAGSVEISQTPTDVFIAAVARFSGYSDAAVAGYRAILNAIADEVAFILVRDDDGTPASCLIAGLHRDVATVFSVVTDPARRRRGFARRTLAAAFDWATQARCTLFWIGVEADNDPALALYTGHGFTEAYRYHYRQQAGEAK